MLLATIQPDLADSPSPWRMAVLGVGMGLIASQLGIVVQSSVDASGRGEAGGLQYTGQQLGSSLGVALIGAIVLAGLTGAFVTNVESDERISDEVAAQVSVAAGSGIDFVASADIEAAAQAAGLDEATTPGDRRRLRAGPAPVAQGRPAGRGADRPRLAGVHQGPAELRPCRGGGCGDRRRRARAGRGVGPRTRARPRPTGYSERHSSRTIAIAKPSPAASAVSATVPASGASA